MVVRVKLKVNIKESGKMTYADAYGKRFHNDSTYIVLPKLGRGEASITFLLNKPTTTEMLTVWRGKLP